MLTLRLSNSQELDVHYDPVFHSFNVYHEPFVDSNSVCRCLLSCLAAVTQWSALNPGHTLLKIVVEPKYNIDLLNPYHGGATGHMLALQAAILSVVPAARVLAPAVVQGSAPSMRAAVTSFDGAPACGWPSDAETRGALMFILDAWGENAAAGAALRNLPLNERLFFVRADDPERLPEDAAVVEIGECECDKPRRDTEKCISNFQRLVRAGYMLRAATDVAACASLDTTQLTVGIATAGVQVLTTDFLSTSRLPCGADRVACCVPGVDDDACTAERRAPS